MTNDQAKAWVPWAVFGGAILYLGAMMIPRGDAEDGFHYQEFGTLPVQEGGRIQPFDTFARVKLMHISHRMSFTYDTFKKDPNDPEGEVVDKRLGMSPSQWALHAMMSQFREDLPVFDYRVFRIDNDALVDFLELKKRPGSWRYSWNEFADNEKFREQVKRIVYESEGPKKDDIFENKIAELWGQVVSFMKVMELQVRMVHPPGGRNARTGDDWLTLVGAAKDEQQGGEHKALDFYKAIIQAYVANKPDEFNSEIAAYQKYLERARPADYHSARWEAFFNRFEPFYRAALLYGVVFILAITSWLVWFRPLQKAAFSLAALVFVVHTWALIMRIYLTGRPPVTNLYSSAVFIGWGCVGLCLFLEWIYRSGVAIVVGSVTGIITLIVAHNLVTGDTMEMLQAVLDTNFWLATHVICITFGYTATFVAGFLGMLYIFLGVFTPRLRGDASVDHAKMIYGVLCFATLLSFVGTVLGGIWADESWGRFWGWDPKENGALLIVVWNALILHARWGGMVRARGMATLAVFGNCVTAWSWFGTNLLGVGLHSYGFMKGAMLWLLVFVVSQLIIIGVGCTPLSDWKSFAKTPPPRDDDRGASPKATELASV